MENKMFSKVFGWMFIGLLMTFITAIYVSTNENILYTLFTTKLYLVTFIAEIVLVIFLSSRIKKMSVTTARITFLVYSFLTGLTFSSIFVAYKLTSITLMFLIAAILFLIFALIGKYTKVDLTKFRTLLIMMLFGVLFTSIINIFLGNSTFDTIICIISIIVFLGFTAYDIQKIELLKYEIEEDKLAIYGALQLYLDFINIFIDLLRLFGSSRN